MSHPSRKKLWEALVDLKSKYPTLKIPESYKDLSDEIFGKDAFIFLHFDTMETRRAVEDELEKKEFKVERDYCTKKGNCQKDTPHAAIQVAYFKGWHWDE